MSYEPLVTVLIPARNEEVHIEWCLRAVLVQDHPHDRMEVVLVDGASTDVTAAVARQVLGEGDIDWKLIDNPVGTTPSNLNVGLAAASGEILCRVDARSIIPPEYVRLCVQVLISRPKVVVTGGAQVAIALDDSARSVGIARALNNKYAMGGSRYRSGKPSGPSDTVYLGAFRTEQLREAGGWDEYFETNQDYELNRRMGRHGIVWFDDRLAVRYVPRQTLTGLWRQYHRFGRWKVRYWRRMGENPQRRQLVPLVVLPVLGAGLVAVIAASPSRRAAGVRAGVLGLAPLFLLDRLGSPGIAAPQVRATGALAGAAVVVAWTLGVGQELARRGSSGEARG